MARPSIEAIQRKTYRAYRRSGKRSGTDALSYREIYVENAPAATIRSNAAAKALKSWRAGRSVEAWRIIADAKDVSGLVISVTQHWFRHLLATYILGQSGDIRSAMEQGGWLDPRSVIGYTHDAPQRRRDLLAGRMSGDADTSLTPMRDNGVYRIDKKQ